MNDRTLAWALYRLWAWALRPVAVQNGIELRAVAAVGADRKLRAHDDAETVAERV